ncbi:hypothetical protein PAMP_024644 [Pampus punctatissimus]
MGTRSLELATGWTPQTWARPVRIADGDTKEGEIYSSFLSRLSPQMPFCLLHVLRAAWRRGFIFFIVLS